MRPSLNSNWVTLLVTMLFAATISTLTYAQTTTYHLHKEASTTSGLDQLKSIGPDSTSFALLSNNLQSASVGEYLIQQFDSQAGDPGNSGTIPSGSTVTLAFWMRKTASIGTMTPRAKVFLNSAVGTPLCTANGTTALSTKLTKLTFTCNTSAAITVSITDRYYLWVGVNLTATSNSSTFQGELDIEGTLNGNFDSSVTIPVPPAVISSLSPSTGAVGASIIIAGQNFGLTQGTSSVTFSSGKISAPTSWSTTKIVAPVPSRAISGNVTVAVGGVTSNGMNLTVVPAPSISSVSPASGTAGTAITITGANFSTSPILRFNGVAATILSFSPTSISTTVPFGATTGNVVVTASGVNSNGVAFTVPAPSITTLSPSSGIAGTAVTISGTNFGSIAGGVTFSGTSAIISSWSNGSVIALTPSGVTSGNVVATSGSLSSNALPFSAVVPNITTVSPTTGVGGTQVTVAGTGFGATQGIGSVWLGSNLGAVLSWADNQIVATVSPGSASGVVQVQRPGVSSNTVPFTVNRPTVSAVSPTSGVAGTQVTLTGSAFGNLQGSGQVWLGTAPAIVNSWTDTQVIATLAAGSLSGTAQILQNGALSNAIAFAVNLPQISNVTPNSGSSGAAITITGSGFGSAQGSGIVWVGSAPGGVTSWSDTQVVATVSASAVSGNVRVQQNGIWSSTVGFTVPPSLGATSVTVSPSLISMVVGETRTLQATDSSGQPVVGLTWASTDTNIATLSADDPPIITAVSPGHVSITAGNSSADVTVYPGPVLPVGTVRWSVPGDASGFLQILPAVPSTTGVADVFAVQRSGGVQAISADGIVKWTATPGTDKTLLADFQGGLVVADSQSVKKLNAATGQANPAYTLLNSSGSTPPVLVHTDGTIITVDGGSVVGIDPATGNPKFSIPLEQSVRSSNGNCGEFTPSEGSGPPEVGRGIIAGDGFAYIPYVYARSPLASNMKVCNPDGSETSSSHMDTHLRILRVAMDGTFTKVSLGDWTQDGALDCVLGAPLNGGAECALGHWVTSSSGAVPGIDLLGTLITNADQGVVYLWTLALADVEYKLTPITGGIAGTSVSLAIPGSLFPMLQASDGTYFGTVSLNQGMLLIAFDQSGTIRWNAWNYVPVFAAADGSLIVQSADGLTYATLDQSGNAVGQHSPLLTQSWTGDTYRLGSVEDVIAPPNYIDGASFWPQVGGNPSGTGTAILQCPCLLQSATTVATAISASGSQKKYLLLVGDPGLNLGNGHNHNVGQLFGLAAQTQAQNLNAANNSVITQRVSSVSDFNSALTTNGIIDGGITFFGHGGMDGHGNWALFPGENPGDSNNITVLDVGQLSNANLSLSTTITLNACHAGLGGRRSVAQLIANQLKRTVFAYPVDLYFSSDPAPRRYTPTMRAPSGVPTYMVPNQDGMQPTAFNPN
jgi:hypothetical protein